MAIAPGDKAPLFTLMDHNRKNVSLEKFLGRKNVILVFFVFAFTDGWTSQILELRKAQSEFSRRDTQVLGISCDSTATLAAYNLSFGPSLGYPVQLLSDFYPHGDVTKKYKLFNSEIGTADRSAVVIDKNGYVRKVNKYQYRSVLGPNGYGIVDLDFNVKDLISFIEDL